MMAEVGAYRRGGWVLPRTAGNGDLAWEDHRTAVPLEVNASIAAQKHGLGLLRLKFRVHGVRLVCGEVGVGHDSRADGIWHVHATADIHKPRLLQAGIQLV